MDGMTIAAPMPSMSDQPTNNMPKPLANAVIKEPTEYTIAPITKVRRRPMRAPRPAPARIRAAIVRVNVAMGVELTVVSRSATTTSGTFMTVPSTTMTKFANPSTMIGSHCHGVNAGR